MAIQSTLQHRIDPSMGGAVGRPMAQVKAQPAQETRDVVVVKDPTAMMADMADAACHR